MPIEDSYIAATALRHGLTIVTGNDRHFRHPGLKVFNPFKELPKGFSAESNS
jgi:toxin FitB